jgi:hypothetical protein
MLDAVLLGDPKIRVHATPRYGDRRSTSSPAEPLGATRLPGR